VRHVILGLTMTGLVALPAAAQQTTGAAGPFDWTGQVGAGGQVRILDVRGDIRVTAATGDRTIVHAEIHGRHGRRSSVIVFDVMPDGNDVTICARWADRPSCSSHGLHDDDGDHEYGESAAADFTVELPRALRLAAETGNGSIDIAGAGTDVDASSGNGAVRVVGTSGPVHVNSGNGDVTIDDASGAVHARTGNGTIHAYTSVGPVTASTGNGSIDVRMQTLPSSGPMDFTTGNGSVTVTVPATLAAMLDADTGHGRIESDFPITISGHLDLSHVRAAINGGGPTVHLSTGNGNLMLRKT
jgi:DUF4097 and DUF4098 domain-containing protein YvlB